MPITRTTLCGGAGHARRPREPAARGRDVGRGPGDRGQRVQARERVQDRAGRRQHLVELAQDRRALDVRAQAGSARRLGGDGGGDPDDAEAERRAEQRSERAVEQPQCRASIRRATQPQADTLEAAREDRAGEQGADQPERGRIRRGRALGQQQRTQAGAEEGTDCETAEREHTHDEALAEAEDGEDRLANATISQSS